MIDMTPHHRAKRSRGWGPCLAIAMIGLAPGLAAADDHTPLPPPAPSAPAPAPYPPLGGAPPDAPPGYAPPGYAAQPPGMPGYRPEEITDVDEGTPVPNGYTRVSRKRKGLIISGAVTLGATYLTTAVVATAFVAGGFLLFPVGSDATKYTRLYLPVVGPFLAIGQFDRSRDQLYLAASGLGQTVGAIMLVYGITRPRTVLVRNDQRIVTSVAPLIAPGAAGLSVVGRF